MCVSFKIMVLIKTFICILVNQEKYTKETFILNSKATIQNHVFS